MKKSLYLLLLALLVVALAFAITGCTPADEEGGEKPSSGSCGHIFNEELDYSSDDEAHWYACTLGCGAKYKLEKHVWSTIDETNITKKPTCKEEGHATLKCMICEKEKIELIAKTKHTIGAGFEKNETHHWQACQNEGCGIELNKEAHSYKIAHYDQTNHWLACKCGATDTPVAHTWVDVNENDNSLSKQQKCSAEGCKATRTVGNDNHQCTYDEGTVTVEPTCSTPGIKTFNCTTDGCDGCYTQSITTIPHVYNGAWQYSDTHHWRNCKCGEPAPESERVAHDFSDTPTTNGMEKVYKCECGKFKTEESTGYIDPDGWT